MSVPAQRIVPQHHSEEQNGHIAPQKYQQQREPVVAITFNLELRRKTLVIFFRFLNKANCGLRTLIILEFCPSLESIY
jgi:hypothetical protein